MPHRRNTKTLMGLADGLDYLILVVSSLDNGETQHTSRASRAAQGARDEVTSTRRYLGSLSACTQEVA
jgi:hypothetical protein